MRKKLRPVNNYFVIKVNLRTPKYLTNNVLINLMSTGVLIMFDFKRINIW